MGKKQKHKATVAEKITKAMATWSFVIAFLCFCAAWMEWTLHAPKGLTFDDSTFIHLNLMLSLIAAVQGSVIMISQKYQDRHRDEMLERIDKNTAATLRLEKKMDKILEGRGDKSNG